MAQVFSGQAYCRSCMDHTYCGGSIGYRGLTRWSGWCEPCWRAYAVDSDGPGVPSEFAQERRRVARALLALEQNRQRVSCV